MEVTMNNRPLGYFEDDVERLPLTPNMLIHSANISLPEEDNEEMDETDEAVKMSKRARYIQRCKDAMWRRWTTEYIRSLRERHFYGTGKASNAAIGEIMLIKADDKDRGHWKMGVVQKLVIGKDGIFKGVKLKTSTGILERSLKLLYPMELNVSSEPTAEKTKEKLNSEAGEFKPRSQRAAKKNAIQRLKELTAEQDE